MLSWYMEKLFPIERQAMKIARPIMRSVTDMPLPEDDLFQAVEDLVKDLTRLENLITDPEISSVRLVLNPEKMVIKEAPDKVIFETYTEDQKKPVHINYIRNDQKQREKSSRSSDQQGEPQQVQPLR